MKARGTVTDASDLVADIEQVLASVTQLDAPRGASTLRDKLVAETHRELIEGYFDERRFEELVRDVLRAIGATEARITPRQHDEGADIVAEFPVGPLTIVPVHVQVKWWRPDQGPAGPSPIDQLLNAMDEAMVGMVVTTTEFTEGARSHALWQAERTGKEILLYDGLEFSQLIIDHGLRELIT